jgi:hopanoid biosynthesis associated radical SAM protein HpnH
MAGQPLRLTLGLAWYLIKNKLRRRQRFPLTMILEPLENCNLACQGCGRIREYAPVMDRTMTVEECLAAVEECGAPVVSISGGEPLIHPHIDEIVDSIVRQKRFVYLCTNALLIRRALKVLVHEFARQRRIHRGGLQRSVSRGLLYRGCGG